MPMPGRSYNPTEYRYGFNGKEKDDEVKGSGNSYDFGARLYDPRLGRWLAVDPQSSKYPDLSPYNFVANSPLIFIDPDGEKIVLVGTNEQKTETLAALRLLTNDKLEVDLATGVVKITHLNTENSHGKFSSGTGLIRELNSKQAGAKTVTIDVQNSTGVFEDGIGNKAGHTNAESENAANGRGTNAFVSFDPTSNPNIITEGTNGNSEETQRPNEIGLGHELIHAWHFMTGTKGVGEEDNTYKDASGNDVTQTEKKEELNTVGLKGSSKYTENKLRKEQRDSKSSNTEKNKLNKRVAY